MHIKFVREQKQVNFVKIKWKGKGNPCLFKRHFLQRKPVLSGGGPSSLQRGKSLTCNSLVRKKNPDSTRRPGQVSHEEVFDCIERANQSCVRSNSRWRSRPASVNATSIQCQLDTKLKLTFSMGGNCYNCNALQYIKESICDGELSDFELGVIGRL